MLKIFLSFAWSLITGGDFKSAFLKALRNVLVLGGPFVATWLSQHGVDAGQASHFVSDGIGTLVSGAGIAMSVWDWFSVKKQTAAIAQAAPAIAPPDTTGSTVIGHLDAAEQASLKAASK